MQTLTDKRIITRMVLLFSITYMVSYITRINYGAIISEMITDTGMSKSMLSLAITGSFITYGAGQVISGLCGDRFSPKRLVTCGLILTVLMNLLIPFCTDHYQMLAVWCVNGFAQAFMWPPLVRLMTLLFGSEEYKKASVKVSWGSSFGTILVYLLAPVLITLLGWRSVFFASAACGAVMILLWNALCIDCESEPRVKDTGERRVSGRMLFTPLMIGIMLAIVLQGMLRDGVTTWMPTYINETYDLGNAISILTSVVLPIFSILCFQVASRLYRSILKNPLTCAGAIFGVGVVSAILLYFFASTSAALSVGLAALLTGAMHGVNLMLISMLPPFFRKYGNVSTVSGMLNACTYIGSAISTYGIALLSEQFDWSFTILIWAVIAILGTAICFLSARPWQKQHASDEG